MRKGFVLLVLVFLLLAATLEADIKDGQTSTLDRPLDPVIVTGDASASCLSGVAPWEVVAFRYAGGAWEQIPVQVDEAALLDIVTPYGPYAAMIGSAPPTGVNELFYTDAGTFTGPDPDPTLDADDEVVFMARDAGDEPGTFFFPEGAVPGTGCRVTVTDPLDGGLGVVYLFRQDGSLDPGAGKSYVDYDFDLLTGTYPGDYGIPSGYNPEDTSVTTGRYRHHFSDRWIHDALEIHAGGATGVDILDRHQNFFSPGFCMRTEDTFSKGEGCFVTNRGGPVRAIRSYMGANSGPLTQRTHIFYDGRQDILTDLRVHEIGSIYDVFDYEPAAAGMIYYNDLNLGGLLIDGDPETAVTGWAEWEMVTGPQGSLVIVHDLEGDLEIGTEAAVDSYWEDEDWHPDSDCTGDGLAYGTSGSALFFDPGQDICTDPLQSGCHNLRLVKSKRHIYYEGPGLASGDALRYESFARTPLAVSAEPVEAVPWTLEVEGSYAGGELRLDFDLGAPVPSIWVAYGILTYPAVQVVPLWGVPLPAIDPPMEQTIAFPLPGLGWLGIYTGLYVEGATMTWELVWVDTGRAGL